VLEATESLNIEIHFASTVVSGKDITPLGALVCPPCWSRCRLPRTYLNLVMLEAAPLLARSSGAPSLGGSPEAVLPPFRAVTRGYGKCSYETLASSGYFFHASTSF
jgi:hypothetical protein